ncbi:hypothetical protein Q1695_012318 [Nippostrongylus brasiliensis]|nr:hypothetical protein Q1695_012318 [Nippostrongylus brasiliensis]
MWSLVLITLATLCPSVHSGTDECDFVDKDYCFWFGKASCYWKICECEQNCSSNCTTSSWCNVTHRQDRPLVNEVVYSSVYFY